MVVPAALYVHACRGKGSVGAARVAAGLALLGIVLNRLNVSVIAFRWNAPVRYVPSWAEVVVTLAVISAELWAFRWVVNRMPVLATVAEDRRRRFRVPAEEAA